MRRLMNLGRAAPKAAAYALVVTASAVASSGCFLDNDVKDSTCTPDDPSIDLNDDCAFRDSIGPQIDNPDCQCSPDTPVDPGVTWEEAFTVMTDDNKGACSLAACHGEEASAANGIFLPKSDALRFYHTLS